MGQPEPCKPLRLLVTGSTGFVGAAVRSELRTRQGVRSYMAGRTGHSEGLGPSDQIRHIDLADARTLQGVVEGVDAVLHLASCISGPDDLKKSVNTDSTRALVKECRLSGASRIVRLSTASVYGTGPWSGEDIQGLPPRPSSTTSHTRLLGDDHVLEADGCVVRPHLVHGPGDRWFVPRATEIVRTVGWVEPRSLHSTIHVTQLATLLVDLALGVSARCGVVLAADNPIELKNVLQPALRANGDTLPRRSTTTLTSALAHPAGQTDGRWSHDVHLLGADHFLTDSLGEEVRSAGHPRVRLREPRWTRLHVGSAAD